MKNLSIKLFCLFSLGFFSIVSHAQEDEVFKVVEQMPRFPGCDYEDMKKHEAQTCSNEKLIQYIGAYLSKII